MAISSTSRSYNYFLLLLIFCASLLTNASNSDMSIISYYDQHITINNVKTSTDQPNKPVLSPEDELMSIFESWMKRHDKTYSSAEEKENRFKIFKDNMMYINKQNMSPINTYKLGLNRFADLTNNEFRNQFLGDLKPGLLLETSDKYQPKEGDDDLPDSIDWREKGAAVPVKDQKNCRSSWAFSAIASVEAINKIVTGDLISLSEQELVDCDDRVLTKGCRGDGSIAIAFMFIHRFRGIHSEQNYPYTGRDDETCDRHRKDVRIGSIDGYERVPSNNEKALMKAVASQPVSTWIDASGRDIQLYDAGIFNGKCGTALSQGVNVVGYASDHSYNTKYWIVRNSWGESWGEKGYLRLKRDVPSAPGLCSIAAYPSYPIKKYPSPSPSPSTICEDKSECPLKSTCCCKSGRGAVCNKWGCCVFESATCCKDQYHCCPKNYPVCDIYSGNCTMIQNKNDPFGVKPMQLI